MPPWRQLFQGKYGLSIVYSSIWICVTFWIRTVIFCICWWCGSVKVEKGLACSCVKRIIHLIVGDILQWIVFVFTISFPCVDRERERSHWSIAWGVFVAEDLISFSCPAVLIITPVFERLSVPMGVFKNFYIHISQSEATDGFSNCTYSRQERKQRQSICWQERLYSIFSRWLRQPDHTDGQLSRTLCSRCGTGEMQD